MADHLASIYGTEKDKVNCSFYFKIGACRHGDRCSRKHVKPNFSQTVLLSNVYQNPAYDGVSNLTEEQLQEHFDLFFEDMFMELAKYGEVEEMNVCDNVGDHLVGSKFIASRRPSCAKLIMTTTALDVYVRFKYEENAGNAVDGLNNRFYAGRPLYAELSPVTDFGEACCRQYEMGECTRGGFCNFMHLKLPSRKLEKELFQAQDESLRLQKKEKRKSGKDRSASRSRSPSRDRKRRDRSSERNDRRRRGNGY
ncbi:Splicing factor U2AF 26 kDa subunit [Gaertneriomyces sp. JEL0708]|nr:Splicing factor U2AF 26 kDa subunit [Gaertneriomyces sp. JEL0708]